MSACFSLGVCSIDCTLLLRMLTCTLLMDRGAAAFKGYYSYNQGVILGGLADLYLVTNDTALLDAGVGIANTTLALFVTANGVLQEAETISSQDAALFKGIFMRNLAKFASVLGGGNNGGGEELPSSNGADLDSAAPNRRSTRQQHNARYQNMHLKFIQFIKQSAQAATAKAMTADYMFASDWEGPVDPNAPGCTQNGPPCGTATGPSAQVSALMLLAAT